MQKRTWFLAASLGAALLLAALGLLHAQAASGGGATSIGPINLDWGAPGKIVGDHLVLHIVHMTSTNYDLTAETVTVDLQTGKKGADAFSVAKATAIGNSTTGTQVVGRFESVRPALTPLVKSTTRTYLVNGDQAVYTPDPSRPDGGKVDFTGHVTIRITAPDALSGDAVTHVEHATVLLGKNSDKSGGDAADGSDDYPQIDFSAGHLEFTPLQKDDLPKEH